MKMPQKNFTAAEKIAADTWDRIKYSREFNVRLGEETLTDLLTLDFKRFTPSHLSLIQTTKLNESKQGNDLEIRIQIKNTKAIVFAIQSKKIYESGRYNTLNYKSSSIYQIDILEKYSKKTKSIPIYLLYNYIDIHNIQSYWHCCKCFDKKQLGCTIIPSWIVRQAINKRGCRKFQCIHKLDNCALPWRCLFNCPKRHGAQKISMDLNILSIYQNSLNELGNIPDYNWVCLEPIEGAWPEWLWKKNYAYDNNDVYPKFSRKEKERTLSIDDWNNLWSYCESKPNTFPKRLLLVKNKNDN